MVWEPKFSISTRQNKKYSVITPSGNTVHFGSKKYGQFKDSTGLGTYSHKDHLDLDRRELYRRRARGIKDGTGRLAYRNRESPAYYSYNFLWN